MKRFLQFFSLIVMLCLWGTGSMYAGDFYYGTIKAVSKTPAKGKVYLKAYNGPFEPSAPESTEYSDEVTQNPAKFDLETRFYFYAQAAEGCTFDGWYEKEDCSGEPCSTESPYIPTIAYSKTEGEGDSKTLFAKFSGTPAGGGSDPGTPETQVTSVFTYTATADQGYSFFGEFRDIGTVSYEKWTDASTPVTVTVDGKVTEIPDHFFYASQLTSITLPSSVESIGDQAFSSSSDLAKVEFSSIPLVADGAFGFGSNIEYTLALTDDSYVYTDATNSFPAVTSATYTRTMPTDEEGNPRSWGSAVLPFTIVTADQTGVKPYCFSGVSSLGNEDAALTVEVMESVGAGHPFLFCNTAGNASVTFANVALEGQTINISTTIVEDTDAFSDENCSTIDIYMYGTYGEEQTSSSDENIYFIAQDQFWWAEESINISSFRAWFEILITENDGEPEGGDDPVDAPARSFTIEVGDETEGITTVRSEAVGVSRGFDLSGRQVGAGQKGLQIRDGRVMFVKIDN